MIYMVKGEADLEKDHALIITRNLSLIDIDPSTNEASEHFGILGFTISKTFAKNLVEALTVVLKEMEPVPTPKE